MAAFIYYKPDNTFNWLPTGTFPTSTFFVSFSYLAFLPNWVWYQKGVAWSQQTFVLVKTYWRRLKDVFSVSFCLPRCLQDIRRLEDILKTIRRRSLVNMSWRRFEGALKTSCEDVLKTFLEDVEDVLEDQNLLRGIKNLQDVLEDQKSLRWRRFQDIFKTFWETRNVCWDTCGIY